MNNQIKHYVSQINSLSVRERTLIFLSALALISFIWWQYYAQPLLDKTGQMEEQNVRLVQEIETTRITVDAIEKRISEGVHKARQSQLISLKSELDKIDAQIKKKTLELIEPEEMFNLMQQLLYAESKLTLTELRRKRVIPTFKLDENDGEQPQIYRHVMQVQFIGSYERILRYLNHLEGLDWKLMWDKITLTADDYPEIRADIEISTLSDSKNWVGL